MSPDSKALSSARKAIDPVHENPYSAASRKKAISAAIRATAGGQRATLAAADDAVLFEWVTKVLSGAGCLRATWLDALDRCRSDGWRSPSMPRRDWLVKALEG